MGGILICIASILTLPMFQIIISIVLLGCAFGYEFRSSLARKNTVAPKFNPTYVQTLRPTGENVLTTDTATNPFQNPNSIWTENWATVVACGPGVSQRAAIKEGDVVLVPPCKARVALNAPNGADDTTTGLYCVYPVGDVQGKIVDQNKAGNRAYKFTSRLQQAPGKMYGGWGWK
eukprot:NODE_215_length_2139_cov_157.535885_g113_i1.p1 GENE.NODE_215_length_2139_cov_157.535885_g113_i1~~NODE_215_length_2139_cov_157.535885_g113_i1.p1  ORF type:complete len:185 (+),score=27.75 NODE_215_length_2139_cov_157.535885_g113_i1:33-557(+)